MNRLSPCPMERMPWPQRLLLVLLGSALLTLLIVAAVLQPDHEAGGRTNSWACRPARFNSGPDVAALRAA